MILPPTPPNNKTAISLAAFWFPEIAAKIEKRDIEQAKRWES